MNTFICADCNKPSSDGHSCKEQIAANRKAAFEAKRGTEHHALAVLWCQYNGQRGTDKQTAPVMRQLSLMDLRRMLTQRGVQLPELVGA